MIPLLVVGGGAAGLWAAARAAELGARVVLLEKMPRLGTKVLASGGTRCNLTTTLGPGDAARLFGKQGERFLRRALRALPPQAVRERFDSLGVPTVEAPLEKVFPASDKARDVRDALVSWAQAGGVEFMMERQLASVEPLAQGAWGLTLADGSTLEARRVILAAGGRSYPKTGTTGDGYRWLRKLGLKLIPCAPALVPLVSPAEWVAELTGISLQEVEVRLLDPKGRLVARRERPVVFTHRGLSGPGAMDLSAPIASALAAGQAGAWTLQLDCLPAVEREELRELLIAGAAMAGGPGLLTVLARGLELTLPKRLFARMAAQAGLPSSNPPAHSLNKAARHRLIEALKGFQVPIDGTLGYERAEVTAGGLDLGELDPGSMQLRAHPGLYVCGELLDLQGPIGGLNFLSAFATAEVAAQHASAALLAEESP